MKVWGVYDDEIRELADEVGLAIWGDWRGTGIYREGRAYRFRLKLRDRREDGRLKFQKLGYQERKTSAVCWHGHREFLTALFRRFPDARVKTALADYYGRDDFHRTFRATCGMRHSYYGDLAGVVCVCNTPIRPPIPSWGSGATRQDRRAAREMRRLMVGRHYQQIRNQQQRIRSTAARERPSSLADYFSVNTASSTDSFVSLTALDDATRHAIRWNDLHQDSQPSASPSSHHRER